MTRLWLVRHGETEWSRDGRHTSTTDLPLTATGEETARTLRPRLAEQSYDLVLCSPRRRARRTAELAGFDAPELTEDLAEWAYGDYEGVSTEEIRRTVPGWTVWSHAVPGGEDAADVTTRLDRVVARVARAEGDTLAFAHGHSLRGLAARWLGLDVRDGRLLRLDTATVSVLGFEREHPAVLRWNG